jgi:hypothetical protein
MEPIITLAIVLGAWLLLIKVVLPKLGIKG